MSLTVQFISLLVMVCTGIIAGAIIDHLQMLSIAHHPKKSTRFLYIGIEVMGWIGVGCWTFYMLYLVRDGAWRIYDPFAQLSGLLLYSSFFYKPFRFVSRLVYLIVIAPILWMFSLVWRIIKALLSILYTPFIIFYQVIHRIFRRFLRNPF